MAGLTSEQLRLFGTDTFERFERCSELQSPELLGVVVRQQPVSDVASQVLDRSVMECANGGVLDRSDHALGLPVGRGMIWLGEPVLYVVFGTDPCEDMGDEATLGPAVMLDELNPIVGQYRVDLVGNGSDQRLEEAGSDQLRGLPIDAGEDQLRSAVHGHEQMGFAALVAQFGNIDVEVADLVGLKPLWLLAIHRRQTGDAVALEAAMQ